MKIKIFIILFFAFSFFLADSVSAMGIGANPSSLDLELETGKIKETSILFSNISQEAGIFQIYPDDLTEWIKIEPSNFRLEARENKEVKIKILAKEEGRKVTNLSAVAVPLDRQSFGIGSGLKIPLRLNVAKGKSISLASISAGLKQNFPWILAGISLTSLVGISMLKYLKKRKRFVVPKNLPIEDPINLNMEKKNKIILSIILVVLGLVFRLLPHPWNFMPISAIALFAGVYLGGFYALLLPLAAVFFSDIFLGFYDLKLILAVYLSFVLVGLVGLGVRRHKNPATVILGSLTASVLFFLITNFAVWVFTPWYIKTLSGLINCFIMAMPFFRNTLLGDLFYVTVFFGGYETVRFLARKGFGILAKNNFTPQP